MPLLSSKLWKINLPFPEIQSRLAQALNISPVMAQLLINRGITELAEAKNFLSFSLAGLHDPFLIKDMDKAVERIKSACRKHERVLIYGDYDVDGLTSLVLLTKTFEQMGLAVDQHIQPTG